MLRRSLVLLLLASTVAAQDLRTVAEATDYRATARHPEVVDFCRHLDESSDLVRLVEVGRTREDRTIPALLLADPSIDGPEAAAKAGKLVVLVYAGVHAGEICGKEALLALARDVVGGADRALLEHLVVVFVPIYNADGNERVRKDNRPGQVGPEDGMGIRANAMGLDLNRDFVKLEAPETRALVRFLDSWDPAIVVDSHTTDGSRHAYTMTWDSPRHPGTDPALLAYARDEFLPEVGRQLEATTGYAGFWYGNFAEGDVWETYPAWPRYSTHYLGLTNRIGILAEAYAYASFKDRVLATRGFVLEILRRAAASRERIREVVGKAVAGRPESIPLRVKSVALGEPVPVRGEEGERTCRYLGLAESTLSTPRPFAYVLDPTLEGVARTLQRHGIAVEELREDLELDLEVDRVDRVERAERPFEGHAVLSLGTTRRTETAWIRAGAFVVRTDQALGSFAAYLLEGQSEDGLAAWNLLDPHLAEGRDYPVRRLPAARTLLARRARALPEDRGPRKRLTFDQVNDEDRPLDLGGDPTRIEWRDDERFVQQREGRSFLVEARTGRAEPEPEVDLSPSVKGLQAALSIDEKAAARLLGLAVPAHDPARGRLVRHERDLWLVLADGTPRRLTGTPGVEELVPTFSPDDRLVAFVAENDLHVVETAGGEPHAVTTGGEGPVANGYLDWVYEEEVYGRGNRRGYWWSPDGSRLAFLQVDDRPVPSFTVIDEAAESQAVETTPYPRAGEPNPIVRLGVTSAAGGEVEWADLAAHDAATILITGVGWFPDSKTVWFYVQDRIQSWLEMDALVPGAPGVKKLLADRNGHWVDPPGDPTFLSDGSFLLPSERTGWRHLYRYAPDGTPVAQVTTGDWEVRDLAGVDEAGGWVYVTGTRDDPIADHLYRVRLDGTSFERLTFERGSHRIDLSPGAKLFADTFESAAGPAQVVLRRADGARVRTLDANPVPEIEDWDLGRVELVRIPAEGGADLAGLIVYPPDFDPSKKYPVWFKTYGGPHAPTVRDGWWGGRLRDRQLAAMGFVVFYADPRSASGRGAVSTWAAYKQLGVPELADVETAIRWISKNPWVAPERIGMSGHSYGGFLTAYCLTHSRLFAAGVAGAPVTDWRLYDTIYTERFMDTPQANQEGYDRTSVVKAAADLHGRLLLVHGGFDDNVHVQNTLQLADALQRHDKDFELMIYPRNRHGIGGRHYQRLVVDFMVRTLRPERGR